MVWMMFAVIGIPIKQTLGLNQTELGALGGFNIPMSYTACRFR